MKTSRLHLQAAIGFLYLGLPDEAWRELMQAEGDRLLRVETLGVRGAIYMHQNRWNDALIVSEKLCNEQPHRPENYLNAATCLYHLGRIHEALAALGAGPASIRKLPEYFYNLACYEVKLGHYPEARRALGRCFNMDKKFQELARQNVELRTLWIGNKEGSAWEMSPKIISRWQSRRRYRR